MGIQKSDLDNGLAETSGSGLRKKATAVRWKIAQESEKQFWNGLDKGWMLNNQGDIYKRKSKILLEIWKNNIKIDKNAKILQIGPGALDVIHYLPGKRYAIDPLADFMKEKFKLDYGDLKFMKGRGEEIPFQDKFFDVVIIANVLDHVEDPEKVLREIKRVLKDKGILHFENNFYQKKFIQAARTWGKAKEIFTKEIFNIHHPYMFTVQDIKNLIAKDFSVSYEEIGRNIGVAENLEEVKKKMKTNKKLRRRIAAGLGLIGRINYLAVCRKK